MGMNSACHHGSHPCPLVTTFTTSQTGVSAGAKVLGSFTIGDNSKIGAGSVVLEEVPENSTVVGVPGRVVKRDNVSLPQDELDQVHLPDPIKDELLRLKKENAELSEKLSALEKTVEKLAGSGK